MTPTCPNCKAKFSHDAQTMRCSKCGLPDQVREAGDEAIAGWLEMTNINKRLFGRKASRDSHDEDRSWMTKGQAKRERTLGRQRRRNKHGRRGVHAR